MSVLVRNESNSPWIFDRSAGKRQLAVGEMQVISESEWESIITAKRGPGQINALWPAQTDLAAVEMDYDINGNIIFIGIATNLVWDQGLQAYRSIRTSDPPWTIKKLTYVGSSVVSIQSLENAIWDNRASLGWS